MNVFDLFSVKTNNSQLSWLNIILQRQSFSCWWLPQVTEPRRVRTGSGPGDSGSSGHARVRSQRSRRTLSWSHSLCLANRFYRGPQIRSHPSWRFVTHSTCLLNICDCFHGLATIFVSLCCVQVQQWHGAVIGDYIKLRQPSGSAQYTSLPAYSLGSGSARIWIISWHPGLALFVTSYQE